MRVPPRRLVGSKVPSQSNDGHLAAIMRQRRALEAGAATTVRAMTIQRMDYVRVVVDDHDAAVSFVELGMELDGCRLRAPARGPSRLC